MNDLIGKLEMLSSTVGNTPLIKLSHPAVELYCKIEHYNLSGSIKDRVTLYALRCAILKGEVNQNTVIIESSSGNLASSLAQVCHVLGLKFIPVVDPNINKMYLKHLHNYCEQVEIVTERDDTGGFLKSRLKKIEKLRMNFPDSFWLNQYGNPDCADAHYFGTGTEILRHLSTLDYLFVGVGTGSTLSGVSRKIKEENKNIKIIAVDVEGSVIFQDFPKKRFIPGLGSSIKPQQINNCIYDEIIYVSEKNTIDGCRELSQNGIFGGGSSGTVYYAINQYFKRANLLKKPNVMFLSPDRGSAYLDTVYSKKWCSKLAEGF